MTYQDYQTKQKWSAPKHVDDASLSFGGDMKKLLPQMADIPDEFRRNSNIWVQFQQDWFYKGLAGASYVMKPGIPQQDAIRHLAAIQSSFEPKHEHKEAGVAYLASLWFEKITAGDKVYGN